MTDMELIVGLGCLMVGVLAGVLLMSLLYVARDVERGDL